MALQLQVIAAEVFFPFLFLLIPNGLPMQVQKSQKATIKWKNYETSRLLEKGHLTVLNQLTDDHNLMYCFTVKEKMKKISLDW